MTYKSGDILTSKDIWTGVIREYLVTKTTQKSVFYMCVKIGQMPISGEIRKVRPNENDELWAKNYVRLSKA